MATVKIDNKNNIIKNNIQNNDFNNKENNINNKTLINKGINTDKDIKLFKEKKHIKNLSSSIPVYYPILNKSKLNNNKNIFINSGLNVIKNNNHTIQSYNHKNYRKKNKKLIDNKETKESISYIDKISNDEIFYYLKPDYKRLENMNKHINGFIKLNRFKDKLKIEMKYHFFKNKFLRNKNYIGYK